MNANVTAFSEGPSISHNLDPWTDTRCTGYSVIHYVDVYSPSQYPYELWRIQKGPVGSVVKLDLDCGKRKFVRQTMPLTSDDARDYGLLALTLNANGDREQAIAMARKAVGLDRGNFWAELSYGLVLEDSNSVSFLFSSDLVLDDSKRLDKALQALKTPKTSSDYLPMDEALLQIHLAVLYAQKGDMAKAQEIYFDVVNNIDLHCVPAVKEKDAFMALVQPMVKAHLATAKQLDAQGKYAESLPEYAQALSFAANEQETSTLRAEMFAASGKMPTPPEMPDDAHRHVVRGEALLNQGMLERGLAEFNEALRIAPYMPKLYQNTAVIYGGLKQYDQAIRQMHLYLTAAPETPDARTAQDQITKWELQQEMEGKR
jgi:tetratricopeptide (TPR) repeat protein